MQMSHMEPNSSGWALLVGIQHYDSDQISPLRFAIQDIQALAETLSDPQLVAFPAQQVITMPSSDSGPLRPSHDNVLEQLERLREKVQPQDTFIFYFAGHGIRQGKDDFLLSVNANLRSLRSVQRTAIPLTEVRDICQEIPARRKLIILDACRNDPQMGRGLGDNLLQADFARNIRLQPTSAAVTAPEVAATLWACSVGERAYEWPEKQHGVFSHYLLQGLKGEAVDHHGANYPQ